MAQRSRHGLAGPLGRGFAGRNHDADDDEDEEEMTLGGKLSAKKNGFADYRGKKHDKASDAFAREASKGSTKRQRPWDSKTSGDDDESDSDEEDRPRSKLQRDSSGRIAPSDDMDDDDSEEDDDDGSADDESDGGGDKAGKKRKRNKHAPAEMRSNRPVGRFRKAIEVEKVIRRDPRFDDLSGTFDDRRFRNSYSFLGDVKENEIAAIRKELSGGVKGARGTKESRKAARAMPEERRMQLQRMLTQLQQQRGEERVSDAVRNALASRKSEERKAVAGGKTPYFPKRSELKQIMATERYKALEARGDGAVAKAMKKRRKKLMGKERKSTPFPSRRGVDPSEGR